MVIISSILITLKFCLGRNYMLESLLGLKSQTKILHWSILHLRFISNLGKNICSKNYTQITSMGCKQRNLINNKLTIWLLDNSWIITKAFQLFYALCFVWKLTFTLQSKLTRLFPKTYYTQYNKKWIHCTPQAWRLVIYSIPL